MPRFPMTDTRDARKIPALINDQQNSTALKWGSDGELSDLDLQRILALLSKVDPVVEQIIDRQQESAA